MAVNCQDIINWLKNYFTLRTEDYKYDISISNYNPLIDSNVTVDILVKDGNDEIVSDHDFTLYFDDDSTDLTTDNEGSASYTYACNDWGVHRFSAGSSIAFIRVTGWKNFIDDTNFTGYYNDHSVYLSVHATGVPVDTSWGEFSANVIPTSNPDLTPYGYVVSPTGANARILVRATPNSARIDRASISGSSFTNANVRADLMWKRK